MLEGKNKVQDPVEEVRQTKIEKEQKFIGRIIPKNGHTVFEVDMKNHTIEPATFEEQTASFSANKPKSEGLGVQQFKDGTKKLVIGAVPTVSKKLIRKEGCMYIPALNKKNVIKHLVKRGYIKIVDKND